SRAAVVHRAGLDIEALNQHKRTAGSVGGFAGAETIAPDRLLILPCDVLIPAALENAITKDNAGQIQARLIGEAANGPTTPEADHILQQRQIVVVPDILANAGGVTVSYFEWVQNRLEMYWDPEQVDQKLRETMVRSYRAVAELARADRTSLRAAAYRLAIERVVQAAIERGVQ
ncbi:MAG: Glu/Leu/Phe/Val dehydrogenase, partial [Phycisphaerae bacterium]